MVSVHTISLQEFDQFLPICICIVLCKVLLFYQCVWSYQDSRINHAQHLNSPKHSNCSLCLFSKQTERKCSHCSYTVFHFKQMKQKITSKAPANTTIHCIIDLATELLSNNTWYLWDNRLLPQTFSLLPSNTLMGNSLLHTALYVLHRESAAIFRSRPLSFFTFVVSWKKKKRCQY